MASLQDDRTESVNLPEVTRLFRTKVWHTLRFWTAFILTRPLGATAAVFTAGAAGSRPIAGLIPGLIACLLVAPLTVRAQDATRPAAAYQVSKTFEPGGEGGWDFLEVDGRQRRLYVSRGDTVQVIDTDSGALVTTITGLHGTHGIALTDTAGFITNGRNNSVTVFDPKTSAVIDTIAGLGDGPDAILHDPARQRIYTMNHKGGSVSVIDAVSRKLIRTIPALPDMESGVIDGRGRLFVNSESDNKVAVIDTEAGRMVAAWPLGSCDAPTGLAIDAAHQRLFATCGNKRMVVLDSASGKLVAELPVGGRSDAAAFDPGLQMAYSSNGDGTLTAVHEDDPDHFTVAASLTTQEGARTMALEPGSHALYLPAAAYGQAPAATAATPQPRKPILPGSFRILVVTPTRQP